MESIYRTLKTAYPDLAKEPIEALEVIASTFASSDAIASAQSAIRELTDKELVRLVNESEQDLFKKKPALAKAILLALLRRYKARLEGNSQSLESVLGATEKVSSYDDGDFDLTEALHTIMQRADDQVKEDEFASKESEPEAGASNNLSFFEVGTNALVGIRDLMRQTRSSAANDIRESASEIESTAIPDIVKALAVERISLRKYRHRKAQYLSWASQASLDLAENRQAQPRSEADEEDFFEGEVRDLFISYSSGDRALVQGLVAQLSASEFSYWFDQTELYPGESLIAKINDGLTNARVVLFCVSESFLERQWPLAELRAAIGLAMQDETAGRVVPLMICDPLLAIRKYPIPFADTLYIRWRSPESDMLPEIQAAIASAKKTVNEYWRREAYRLLCSGQSSAAAAASKKALSMERADVDAMLVLLAALGRLDALDGIISVLVGQQHMDLDFGGTRHLDLFDEVQHYLVANVDSPLIRGYPDAVFNVLGLVGDPSTHTRRWQLVAGLMSCETFRGEDEYIAAVIFANFESGTLDWLTAELEVLSPSAISRAVSSLCLHAIRQPTIREEVAAIARIAIEHHSELVRISSVAALFLLGRSSDIHRLSGVVNDGSPEVRSTLLELRMGGFKFDGVDVDSLYEEALEGRAHQLWTPSLSAALLNDSEDFVADLASQLLKARLLPEPERQQKVELGEKLVSLQVLASAGTDENFEELKRSALLEQSEDRREFAIKRLREVGSELVDAHLLEQLWDKEAKWSLRTELCSLISEAAESVDSTIFREVVRHGVRRDRHERLALERLIASHDVDQIADAVSYYMRKGMMVEIVDSVFSLLGIGLTDEAEYLVDFGLRRELEVPRCTLALAFLEDSIHKLNDLTSHDSSVVRVCAYRALAFSTGSSDHVSALDRGVPSDPENIDGIWSTLMLADAWYEQENIEVARQILKSLRSAASGPILNEVDLRLDSIGGADGPQPYLWFKGLPALAGLRSFAQ